MEMIIYSQKLIKILLFKKLIQKYFQRDLLIEEKVIFQKIASMFF